MGIEAGYRPYLISNQRTGIDQSVDPWLTPQDAFQGIFDAYQYKGVLYKRDGYSWFDSVPHVLPNALSYQNITSITLGPNSVVTVDAAHGLTGTFFVRLSDVQGITSPANLPRINGTRWVATVNGPTTFTLNNDQAFLGAYTPGTGTASRFPGNPVMAIANWVNEQNVSTIMVLDTKRASIYSISNSCLIPIGIANQFTGTERNQFWYENYRGKIYFTNNVDSMFYWGSASTPSGGLTPFLPQYDGTLAVTKCLMIKAIGSRLCLFNTEEVVVATPIRFPTRVRWCQDGAEPVPGTGVGNPWDEVTPGRGYFADLLDSRYIISLAKSQTNAFIFSQGSDYGVVYEMRPISDPKFAFIFVNVGTSRNINSTFGTILRDRVVSAVGDSGLVITDGNNIGRYDAKIPEFYYTQIQPKNIDLCYGQRFDLYWQTWLLYSSGLPDANGVSISDKNDRVLVYNYQDDAWSIYRLSMAVLGVVDQPKDSPAFSDYGSNLPDWDFNDFGDTTFGDLYQKESPSLLGGDYSGNLWIMNYGGGDAADNQAYLQPTNEGNPITMNLIPRQWFPYAQAGKASQLGFVDFLVDGDVDTDVKVSFQIDNQGSNYLETVFDCFPYENLLLAEIQNITLGNPTLIFAPNHQLENGQTVWIYGVQGSQEFNGQSGVVTVIDSDNISLPIDSTAYDAYLGGGRFSPAPLNATPFWVRVYCGQTGVFHQFSLTSTGVDENFALHASLLWFKETGRIYR